MSSSLIRLLSMKSSHQEFNLVSWMVVIPCLSLAPFVSEPQTVTFPMSSSYTLTAVANLANQPSPPLIRVRLLVSMTILNSTDLVPHSHPGIRFPPLSCKLQLQMAPRLHSITMVVASLFKTTCCINL